MHPRTIIYAVLIGAATACLRCFSRCQELSPSLDCRSLCGCSEHFAGIDAKSFQTEDGDVYRVTGKCDSSCKEMCFSLSTGWGLHQCLGYCKCQVTTGDVDAEDEEPVQVEQPEPTNPTFIPVEHEEVIAPLEPHPQELSPVLTQEEACYETCKETCANLPPDCIETCSDQFCGGYRPVATSSVGFSGLLMIGVVASVAGYSVYALTRGHAKSRRPKASALAKLR